MAAKAFVVNLSQMPFVFKPVNKQDDELVGTVVLHRKCIEYYTLWVTAHPCYYTEGGKCKLVFEVPLSVRCRIPAFHRYYHKRYVYYSPCPYYVTGGFNAFRPKRPLGEDVIAYREVVTPFGRGELIVRRTDEGYKVEVVKDVAVPLVLADEERRFLKPKLNADPTEYTLHAVVGAGLIDYYDEDGEWLTRLDSVRGGEGIWYKTVGGSYYYEGVVIRAVPLGEETEIMYEHKRCKRLCKHKYQVLHIRPGIKGSILGIEIYTTEGPIFGRRRQQQPIPNEQR